MGLFIYLAFYYRVLGIYARAYAFSVIGSFTDYNLTSKMNFIGLANFKRMFVHDDLFWKSLYNTVYFVIFNVPLTTIFSVFLATVLNQKSKESVYSVQLSIYRQSYQE